MQKLRQSSPYAVRLTYRTPPGKRAPKRKSTRIITHYKNDKAEENLPINGYPFTDGMKKRYTNKNGFFKECE